jgi:hypothetical protein
MPGPQDSPGIHRLYTVILGQAPRRHAAWPKRFPLCEPCPCWSHPGLEDTPERQEELARHRHNAKLPQTLATASAALAQPPPQGTVRLQAPPTPRQRRGHPAHVPVPRLGDPVCPSTCAALRRRRRAARSAPPVPPMLAGAPAETCHHSPPRPIAPNPFALHPLAPLLAPRVGGGLQLGTTRGFHRRNRLTEQRVLGIHAPHPTTQPRWHRRPLPQP